MENRNEYETNHMIASGRITAPLQYSHSIKGEAFFKTNMEVTRSSGTKDIVPLILSEQLLDFKEDFTGKSIAVEGQFGSYNKWVEGKRKLLLFMNVRKMEVLEHLPEKAMENHLFLDGYICRPPIYRTTPMGRKITDILIAVNHPDRKSSYIPCICWEFDAQRASGFPIGSRVQAVGRVQSREYKNTLENGDSILKTAYEVSISHICLL